MHKVIPLDVVETIREGLLVLEPDLTIRFANRSFCQTFQVAPEDTVGRKLYELGNGQWDIPKLRTALETIISGRTTIEAFEVDQFFPSIGRRIMLLNARKIYRPGNKIQQILLAIEDVTERVRLEREHAIAHQRIAMLMQELTHRVKNSLQSIAAMVMIEARSHKSGEGKAALERVSHRIDALGQLYSKLSKSDTVEAVDAATYLGELCRDLLASVQGGNSIVLKTDIESELLPTNQAIPMGLIVNELVTNALKYAFPGETKGTVMVTLKRVPGELRLTVADDGKGVDPRAQIPGSAADWSRVSLNSSAARSSGRAVARVRLCALFCRRVRPRVQPAASETLASIIERRFPDSFRILLRQMLITGGCGRSPGYHSNCVGVLLRLRIGLHDTT
jgi:PAS domain S-box-containing protein